MWIFTDVTENIFRGGLDKKIKIKYLQNKVLGRKMCFKSFLERH